VVLVNTMNAVRALPKRLAGYAGSPLQGASSAYYGVTKCGTMEICQDLDQCDACDVYVNGHTGTPSPALLPLFVIRNLKATAPATWIQPASASKVSMRSLSRLYIYASKNRSSLLLHHIAPCFSCMHLSEMSHRLFSWAPCRILL